MVPEKETCMRKLSSSAFFITSCIAIVFLFAVFCGDSLSQDLAKELGANKLALGHHMDDVIETVLMNLMYQGKYMTMMPKIKSKNFEDISLIRPMYYVEEEFINKWIRGSEIEAISEDCPLKDEGIGARADVKKIIENLKFDIPNFKKNVQKSAHNVYIDAIVGIKKE